jgi:hypothetical protein
MNHEENSPVAVRLQVYMRYRDDDGPIAGVVEGSSEDDDHSQQEDCDGRELMGLCPQCNGSHLILAHEGVDYAMWDDVRD